MQTFSLLAPLQQCITVCFSLETAKAKPAQRTLQWRQRQQLRRTLLAMHTRQRLCRAGTAAAQHSACKPQARMLLTRQVTASNNQQQSMSCSRRGQHTEKSRCSSAGSADQCRGALRNAVMDTSSLFQCGCLPACTCRTVRQTRSAPRPAHLHALCRSPHGSDILRARYQTKRTCNLLAQVRYVGAGW